MVRKKTLKEKQLTMFTARGAGGDTSITKSPSTFFVFLLPLEHSPPSYSST